MPMELRVLVVIDLHNNEYPIGLVSTGRVLGM